jgi:hypothetical protein
MSPESSKSFLPAWVIILLGGLVFFLALAGFMIQGQVSLNLHSISLLVYRVGQIFVLESGVDEPDNRFLAWARILVVLLLFLGIVKLVITVYRKALLGFGLWRSHNHVVICGLGRIGMQLARDVRKAKRPRRLVVIERDANNPQLPACRELGAITLIGDATDRDVLRRAGVHRASRVFAVSGNDTNDVEIAVRLCELMVPRNGASDAQARPKLERGRRRSLECFVHVVDLPLTELFTRHPMLVLGRTGGVDVKVFNVFTNSARLLLREPLTENRPRASTTGKPEDDQVAHYVLVGFGQMGQAFALEAVRLAHFENRKRLRMTVIDERIETKRDRFLARYPRFSPQSLSLDPESGSFNRQADDWASQCCRPAERYRNADPRAVEYASNAEFLDMPSGLCSDDLADQIRRRLNGPTVCPTVIVCFDEDRLNFETAILMQAKMSVRVANVPVYVWLPAQSGLTRLLLTSSGAVPSPGGSPFAAIDDIEPFGVCEESCNLDQITRPGFEDIAQATHELFLAHCEKRNTPSGQPWNDLPEPYRTSNFLVAEHLDVKLAAIGRERIPETEAREYEERDAISDQELELLAEMEHNRWLAERLIDGWTFAEKKNDDRKENPNLCAWSRLTEEQKDKDRDQVRAIPRILKRLPVPQCTIPVHALRQPAPDA